MEKFVTHVPAILRKQLIVSCIEQYIKYATDDNDVNGKYDKSKLFEPMSVSKPSIQRYHSALLFVDISGFTSLSQKLGDVDKLQSFINLYFEKLINIVSEFDGQVVKFAGDALFIVWQTKLPFKKDNDKTCNYLKPEEIEKSVQQAVNCALKLIDICSNFPIDVSTATTGSSFVIDTLQTHSLALENFGSKIKSPKNIFSSRTSVDSNPDTDKNQVFYLNIHCGLSVGYMAGLDVGFEDRWEYILLGKPLSEVAIAESEAKIGELVISPSAYSVLKTEGNCYEMTCVKTTSGYWRVEDWCLNMTVPDASFKDPLESTLVLAAETKKEIVYAHHSLKQVLQSIVTRCYPVDAMLDEFSMESLNTAVLQSVSDDIVRHVHHVVRTNYEFNNVNRKSILPKAVLKVFHNKEAAKPGKLSRPQRRSSSIVSRIRGVTSRGLTAREETTTRSKENSTSTHSKSEFLSVAEQREVVTIFIKLSLSNQDIIESAGSDKIPHLIPGFDFLDRNNKDYETDQATLEAFQNSFEIIAREFKLANGHVRQFIVDDKGCVAIGTFGLKGSMNQENAALAVETSKIIIQQLRSIGVDSSVGITVGHNYCGLVGCSYRQEYAIMGPSVNLSARLMGKAKACSILCNLELRSRDRTHGFIKMPDVIAKGYDAPVATFEPQLEGMGMDVRSDTPLGLSCKSASQDPILLATRTTSHDETKISTKPKTVVNNSIIGRKDDFEAIFSTIKSFCNFSDEVHDVLVKDDSANISKLLSAADEKIFKFDSESVLIVVKGDSGVGKTMFCDHICSRLYAPRRRYSNWNFFVRVNSDHGLKSSEPFFVLRGFLISLLADYYNLQNKLTASEKQKGKRAMAVAGLHLLAESLPNELVPLLPLLSFIAPEFEVFQSNDRIKQMQGIERIFATQKLIVTVVSLYIKLTGNCVLFFIGNANCLDSASEKFIIEAAMNTIKGLIIIVESDNTANLTVFQPFKNLVTLTLEELSLSAVSILLKASLTDTFLCAISEELIQRMYDACAGNALYLVEMMKALQEFVRVNPQYATKPQEAFVTMRQRLKLNRIEEVVCYRFDQVSQEFQILLKAIAVACANGNDTSYPMLVSILQSHSFDETSIIPLAMDAHEAAKRLMKIVEETHQANEFLVFQASSNSSRREALSSPTSAESKENETIEVSINYRRRLEHQIVYSMMLEEQKIMWHENVAVYLKRESAKRIRSSPQQLSELGFHWHSSNNYAGAMACYYEAGVYVAAEMGSIRDAYQLFLLGYTMLHKLRMESGIVVDNMTIKEITTNNLFSRLRANSTNSETHQTKAAKRLTKKDVFKMLSGDRKLLDVTLLLLYRFSLYSTVMLADWSVSISVAQESLELLTVIYNQPGRQSSDSDSDYDTSVEEFYCFDAESCLPAVYNIINLYRWKKFPDDGEHNKELEAVKLMLAIAKKSQHKGIHYLMALAALRNVSQDRGELETCIEVTDELVSLYNFETHSQSLVIMYALDYIPSMITQQVLQCINKGDLVNAERYLTFVEEVYNKMTHLTSLSLLAVYLSVACMELGLFALAARYFQRYIDLQETNAGHYSLFIALNPVILTFMKMKSRYALERLELYSDNLQLNFEGLTEHELTACRSYEPDQALLESILNKKYLVQPVEARSVTCIALDFGGAGVEFMCGRILALKGKRMMKEHTDSIQKYEAIKYFELALEYAHYYMECLHFEKALQMARYKNKCLLVDCYFHLFQLSESLSREDREQNKYNLQSPEFYLNKIKEIFQLGMKHGLASENYLTLWKFCQVELQINDILQADGGKYGIMDADSNNQSISDMCMKNIHSLYLTSTSRFRHNQGKDDHVHRSFRDYIHKYLSPLSLPNC